MMKYAKFVNTQLVEYNAITGMINIGDNIQSHAMDILFRYAGIDKKNILEIPFYGSSKTDEPCYLIAHGHFGRQYDMDFMNNPEICPIFIGFACKDFYFTPEEIAYFKKYEPILCRDEFTKNVLRRYDIEAYISGCLTTTLGRRDEEDNGTRDRYYFVDVKDNYLKLVPERIKENAVFTSQNLYVERMDDSAMKWGEQQMLERLEEYKKNAKIVITSKLHCMTPCAAMGIPTIAVGNNFSYRFSFVDMFLDAYDEEHFRSYDWKVPEQKQDMELVKSLLLDIGKSMILKSPDMDKIRQLDQLYTNRNKWEYCSGIKKQLREAFRDRKSPRYILWGASSGGYAVCQAIREVWPENEMLGIVDSFAEGIFAGQKVQKPQETIMKYPDAVVIISTLSGRKDAEEFLSGIGRKQGRDYFVIHESI